MHIIKLVLLSCSVTILSWHSKAQNHSTVIKTQAMDMGAAWLKNDFSVFVKYMHPGIIAFAGGKETMKTKMDSAHVAMKRFGASVKRYWIGNPGEIIHYKNQLQAILPQNTTLLMALGELTIETSMIVISNNNGKNWWFIDTNMYNADKLKDIDLSPMLVIPPTKKPKLVPQAYNR